MENKNTYLALTIGPVFHTIQSAQRTRMVWAASYFFSHFVRRLMFEELDQKYWAPKILLPAQQAGVKPTHGAGLYPDRMFIQAAKGDLEALMQAKDALIATVAGEIQRHIHNTPWAHFKRRQVTLEEVHTYLMEYIRLYAIEMEFRGDAERKGFLETLGKRLDVMELRNTSLPDASRDYLLHYLYRVNKKSATLNPSALLKDAFGNSGKKFDSLVEITTRSLSRLGRVEAEKGLLDIAKQLGIDTKNREPQAGAPPYAYWAERCIHQYQTQEEENNKDKEDHDEEDQQDKFLEALGLTYPNHFREYHKYIAVISADGDNVGKLLKEMGADSEKLQLFSKALHQFNCKAVKALVQHGAAPIYLGGDDLFFFAPVACLSDPNLDTQPQQLQTIFDLMGKLDDLFIQELASLLEGEAKETPPTLSWGVAIYYYKHPLMDAINAAKEQLEKIKQAKAGDHPCTAKGATVETLDNATLDPKPKVKNAIGMVVQKHSGARYGATFSKHKTDSYALWQKFLQKAIADPITAEGQLNERMIMGITHQLQDPLFPQLLSLALAQGTLDAFFENTFNEPFHKRPESKAYMDQLKVFIRAVWNDYGKERDPKTWIDLIYAALRFTAMVAEKPQND